MTEIRPGVTIEEVKEVLDRDVAEFTVPTPKTTEIVEGVQAYELIFSKYKKISDTEFKLKRLDDYVKWQQDMLRCYTDSFLIDDSIAGEEVFIYCTDHQFKEKSKKGKGKLRATFVIKNGEGLILGRHNLVLHKVHKNNVNKVIDGHIFLLEMALEGYLNDPFKEDSSLEKFGRLLAKKNVVTATKQLIKEIKNIRTEELTEEEKAKTTEG